MMLPESDSRFDRELAEWFSRRGGAWSGTASELLASLKTNPEVRNSSEPRSSAGLYAYLQTHTQVLQSLGVDVLLHHGVLRTVSLRSCRYEPPQRKPPSSGVENPRKSGLAIEVTAPSGGRKNSADSAGSCLSRSDAFNQDSPTAAKSDLATEFVAGKDTHNNGPKEGFFVNTGEALFAIVDMRRQIREQGLDLESTVDLVIERAQQITRCCGIAVGFLPQEIGTQDRAGRATSRREPEFHAKLFQSSIVAGEAVQFPDAQKHPLLGAQCRRENIGSLIMVPIFRHREVAGALEFFFQEKRSFSPGDVMDLGLIAGVISESLGGASHRGAKYASELPLKAKATVNGDPLEGLLNDAAYTGRPFPPAPVAVPIDPETPPSETPSSESTVRGGPAPKLSIAPAQLWLNLKRAWTRHPRRL